MSKKPRWYPDIKGERGSWFATVPWDDGTTERLPVGHETYFSSNGTYFDPLDWGEKPGQPKTALTFPKMLRWIEAVRKTKKIVIQKDQINRPAEIVGSRIGAQLTKAPEPPYFTRVGYKGVFDVDDVIFNENGLKFSILDRYKPVRL